MNDFPGIGEVLETIRNSFHPLRCVSELYDYDSKIRFRVFDNDEALLSFEDNHPKSLQNKSTLQTIIRAARTRLKARGYELSGNSVDIEV